MKKNSLKLLLDDASWMNSISGTMEEGPRKRVKRQLFSYEEENAHKQKPQHRAGSKTTVHKTGGILENSQEVKSEEQDSNPVPNITSSSEENVTESGNSDQTESQHDPESQHNTNPKKAGNARKLKKSKSIAYNSTDHAGKRAKNGKPSIEGNKNYTQESILDTTDINGGTNSKTNGTIKTEDNGFAKIQNGKGNSKGNGVKKEAKSGDKGIKPKTKSKSSTKIAGAGKRSNQIKQEQTSEVESDLSAPTKEHTEFLRIFHDSFFSQNEEVELSGRTIYQEEIKTPMPISSKQFTQQYGSKYSPLCVDKPVIVALDNPVFIDRFEEFELVVPKGDELDPFVEIAKTMRIVSLMYFPIECRATVYNHEFPESCIIGQFLSGYLKKDIQKISESVGLYNFLILKLQKQGRIKTLLHNKTKLSRTFVHELLYQIYSRTVSPMSHALRHYKAFSNFVYGEILPPCFSTMMENAGIKPSHKFLDLGCGVGNCVIQAALEYGCKSFGSEIMEDASTACEKQLEEFTNRCSYYGISHGEVQFFLRESFVESKELQEVVDDIDVVLVNNYVFTEELNEKVGLLLGKLKPGSKIISLKNFVKPGHTVTQYNLASIFHKLDVKEYKFGPESVSWTNSGGVYFIATVGERYRESVWGDRSDTRTRRRYVEQSFKS